jgi:hypothetical protein
MTMAWLSLGILIKGINRWWTNLSDPAKALVVIVGCVLVVSPIAALIVLAPGCDLTTMTYGAEIVPCREAQVRQLLWQMLHSILS